MTTIVVGTNSYIDTDDADAYFGDSLRADNWDALDTDIKSKALITATRMLDRQTWMGEKADDAQALQWPRTGVTDKYGNAVSDASVPQQILDATCELALMLTTDASVETKSNTNGNTKYLKAGEAEIGYFRPTRGGRFPTIIQELIAQFLAGAASAGSGGSYATGTCEESKFSCNPYGLTNGIT